MYDKDNPIKFHGFTYRCAQCEASKTFISIGADGRYHGYKVFDGEIRGMGWSKTYRGWMCAGCLEAR
ncbi:MAG: hypothetical protein LBG62_00600, partial [Candidatus Methanoplasma sp.]|nr:hypothetical protein [Candidatus Methanoplasma sp.]